MNILLHGTFIFSWVIHLNFFRMTCTPYYFAMLFSGLPEIILLVRSSTAKYLFGGSWINAMVFCQRKIFFTYSNTEDYLAALHGNLLSRYLSRKIILQI
jgi:hypothetical protein